MVDSGVEMKAIIDRAVYPPIGSRSFGPFNAPFASLDPGAGAPDYYERARSGGIAILPIIESAEGVRNAEEILGMEGVTGCFIGPYDLRLSLGVTGGTDGPEQVRSRKPTEILDHADDPRSLLMPSKELSA